MIVNSAARYKTEIRQIIMGIFKKCAHGIVNSAIIIHIDKFLILVIGKVQTRSKFIHRVVKNGVKNQIRIITALLNII